MDEKARQAILLLNAARLRATHERTLLGLALLVRRAQVNHLVKPLAPVRRWRIYCAQRRSATRRGLLLKC